MPPADTSMAETSDSPAGELWVGLLVGAIASLGFFALLFGAVFLAM